jgi:uncharacterized membrane protein YfcA
MELLIFCVYMALGAFGGFLAGLLGIGGGIIMAPLLLFIPSYLGLPGLSMRAVAGLTITQALVACLVGALIHKKHKFYSRSLVLTMGPAIFLAALGGGVASKWVSNQVLLALFACLALAAAVLMLLPNKAPDHPLPDQEVQFSRPGAFGIATSVGFLGGLVGQGGSFILIPLMLYVLHIPMRVAVGSNLAIVLASSLAAFLGKLSTLQIPVALAGALVVGIIPGAQMGAALSRRIEVKVLRLILAMVISFAAFRIWMMVLL